MEVLHSCPLSGTRGESFAERFHRNTDRPTDVISLEYKPELDIAIDEEDFLVNPPSSVMADRQQP